jgi:hypothetical protein
VSSVHERLLREQLTCLPQALQRVHEPALTRVFNGRCRIERGTGLLSRAIGRLMRFPAAGVDLPVSVRMQRRGEADVWLRDFNGSALTSTLRVDGDELLERMGPASFRFRLRVEGPAINWQLTRMKVLGIPVPRRWYPTLLAHEAADGERYLFSAGAAHPLIGLLIHYQGWLDARR